MNLIFMIKFFHIFESMNQFIALKYLQVVSFKEPILKNRNSVFFKISASNRNELFIYM